MNSRILWRLNVVKGTIYVVSENERRFVGKIGQFVPVLENCGGGRLIRAAEVTVKDRETGESFTETKDYAVTGTKGHLWLEAELVRNGGSEDIIDMTYFENLADKARASLEEHGYVL